MSKKSKGKVNRLRDVFAEIGLGDIDIPATKEDAQIMAERDGASVTKRERPELPKCNGKLCYPTRNHAEKTKKRRLQKGAATLASYHCPDCHSWHLTSTR